MTVRELILILKRLPQDHEVILQADPEGNNFSGCAGAETSPYIEDGRDGHTVCQEDIDSGCFEADDCTEVVVIWPE